MAAWVAVICVSCVPSADVYATRDPRYTGRMHNLYLVVGQGGIDPDYANGFVQAFRKEMGQRHVWVTARVITGLELDPNLVDREVVASHADGILAVKPTRGVTYYGDIILLTWDATLVDVRTGARVWRARIENKKGSFGTTEGMTAEAANGIAGLLETERLLGGS